MTKITAKLDISEVLIVTPVPNVPVKPQSVQVSGHCTAVMQQVAALIRLGYCPHPSMPIPFYAEGGNMSMMLELGTPDLYYIERAKESMADAAALQEIQYQADVRRAAEVMIANEKAAEAAATKARAIAEHQATVAQLQAELAAM